MASPGDLSDLVTSSEVSGWEAAFAGVTVLATWVGGRLAHRAATKVLGRLEGVSEDARQLLARLAKYFVWLVGIGVGLTFLGAPVQPLLVAAVVIAAVVVLALRGVADNFAAGVVLQTRRPVQLGDEVEVLGHAGTITEMNGRAVVLRTADGRTVHVPNSKVLDNPLVNDSAHALRRTELEVRAARPLDVEPTLATVRTALGAVAGAAPEPAPLVLVTSSEPDRLILRLQLWHEPADAASVTSAAVLGAWAALQAAGVAATVVAPPPPPPAAPPPAP